MKAILISIRPEWVAKILNGEKTLEIRKTAPKCELPITVYIYCTKGLGLQKFGNKYFAQKGQYPVRNGKVVAKFRLSQTVEIDEVEDWIVNNSCVSKERIENYRGDGSAYAWFIEGLEIFDKPKELSEFGLKKVPQSWCYMEEQQ